jgi:hypothetical protein
MGEAKSSEVGVKGNKKRWFSKKFVALFIFSAGAAVAVPIEGVVENFLVEYFPEYYENDAKQIMESQQNNFDEIKDAMSQLRSELKSDEGKQIAKRISGQVSDAMANNTKVRKILASIQDENSRLRFELKNTGGFDGGSDLRIVDMTALKVDASIVISAVGHNAYNGRGKFYLSTDSGSKRYELHPGESFSAINDAGNNCRFSYLGYANDVYRMSHDCKAGAPQKVMDTAVADH